MEFKVHPRLEAIAKAGAQNRADVVFLRGLVAQTGKSSVRIRAGLFGASVYEVNLSDVISAGENPDGSVSLAILGSAPVVIHTTGDVLQVAADDDPRPRPTEEQVRRCIEERRQGCIDTQTTLNGRTQDEAEQICDQPAVAAVREGGCRNPINLGRLGTARLGAEVVSDFVIG
jgi:hypothetical protein